MQYVTQYLVHYTIATTEECDEWYEGQSAKDRVQVDSRLTKIQDEGYFGTTRDLEEDYTN